MDVDDGNCLQWIHHCEKLSRLHPMCSVPPRFWYQLFEYMHRYARHVPITSHYPRHLHLSRRWVLYPPHLEAPNGAIFIEQDPLQRRVEHHLASPLFNKIHHGLAKPLGRRTIEEGCLGAITLLQEPVQSCQHHCGADLVWINKRQCLGHGNKDLPLNAGRRPPLFEPLRDCHVVTFLNVALTLEDGRDESQAELKLVREGEHVVVAQNTD
mmetsp:Transcript_56947/g.137695  ORF Transcript_56947/g.137695 Transcript_56947/m.137695 type:complete len:211 (-) Transcript_56947:660-1292(-)